MSDYTNSVMTDNCIIITQPNGVQTIVDPPEQEKMSPNSGRNSHVTFDDAKNALDGDDGEKQRFEENEEKESSGDFEDSMESGEAMVAHLPLRPRVQTYSSYQDLRNCSVNGGGGDSDSQTSFKLEMEETCQPALRFGSEALPLCRSLQ